MENYFTYQFFNNATAAALLAVCLAAWIASYQYKRQKDIDRLNDEKRKVIDLLTEAYQAVEEVLFIYDRSTRTLLSAKLIAPELGGRDKILEILQEETDYMKIMGSIEIPRISVLLNEKIPLLDKKILSYINLYFSGHKSLIVAHKKFHKDLKQWHDFVINSMGSDPVNFLKYSNEIEQMSIDDYKKSTDELIKEVSIV